MLYSGNFENHFQHQQNPKYLKIQSKLYLLLQEFQACGATQAIHGFHIKLNLFVNFCYTFLQFQTPTLDKNQLTYNAITVVYLFVLLFLLDLLLGITKASCTNSTYIFDKALLGGISPTLQK